MRQEPFYLLIAFIAFIGCMLLAWGFAFILRHRERMMLIEKGINPLESLEKQGVSLGLKVGIVIIGLSIGLAIIAILVSFDALGRSNAVPSSILGLCVGGALVIANSIAKGKRN